MNHRFGDLYNLETSINTSKLTNLFKKDLILDFTNNRFKVLTAKSIILD